MTHLGPMIFFPLPKEWEREQGNALNPFGTSFPFNSFFFFFTELHHKVIGTSSEKAIKGK